MESSGNMSYNCVTSSTSTNGSLNPELFNDKTVRFQQDKIIFPFETAKKFIGSYNALMSAGSTPSLLELVVKPLFSDEVIKLLDNICYDLNMALYSLCRVVAEKKQPITIRSSDLEACNITEDEFNDLMYIVINYNEHRKKYNEDYNNKYIKYFEKISCVKITASFLNQLAKNFLAYNTKLKPHKSYKQVLKGIFNTGRNYKCLSKMLHIIQNNNESYAIEKLQKLENRNFQKFKKIFLDIAFLDTFLRSFVSDNMHSNTEL